MVLQAKEEASSNPALAAFKWKAVYVTMYHLPDHHYDRAKKNEKQNTLNILSLFVPFKPFGRSKVLLKSSSTFLNLSIRFLGKLQHTTIRKGPNRTESFNHARIMCSPSPRTVIICGGNLAFSTNHIPIYTCIHLHCTSLLSVKGLSTADAQPYKNTSHCTALDGESISMYRKHNNKLQILYI